MACATSWITGTALGPITSGRSTASGPSSMGFRAQLATFSFVAPTITHVGHFSRARSAVTYTGQVYFLSSSRLS
jgi:hypothetical protein